MSCSRSAASERALRRSTYVRPASPSASSERTPSAIQMKVGTALTTVSMVRIAAAGAPSSLRSLGRPCRRFRGYRRARSRGVTAPRRPGVARAASRSAAPCRPRGRCARARPAAGLRLPPPCEPPAWRSASRLRSPRPEPPPPRRTASTGRLVHDPAHLVPDRRDRGALNDVLDRRGQRLVHHVVDRAPSPAASAQLDRHASPGRSGWVARRLRSAQPPPARRERRSKGLQWRRRPPADLARTCLTALSIDRSGHRPGAVPPGLDDKTRVPRTVVTRTVTRPVQFAAAALPCS